MDYDYDGGVQINYVTIGKDTYLLEVAESLSGSVPCEYERRSSKKVDLVGLECSYFQCCVCKM